MTKRKHGDFKEYLRKRLQDPALAAAYLHEAARDPDEKVFLIAVMDILEAQGINRKTAD